MGNQNCCNTGFASGYLPAVMENGFSVFDAQWEVGNQIGSGKFSQVFACWRRTNPSYKYALKVISTDVDEVGLQRIQEEISIMKILGAHPGLMQLVEVDESMPGKIRLVLELCEGGELYDRVQKKGPYTEQEAKIVVRSILNAVAYIHSKGIMHRDLKPENILLVNPHSSTEIKISDFGLAKRSKNYPQRLPRSHSICGSDFYLAPEVTNQEEYGSLPFYHNILHKLYRQILERDLNFPDAAWAHISKGAKDFIMRLLQRRPADRPTAEHPWLRDSKIGSAPIDFGKQSLPRMVADPTPVEGHLPPPHHSERAPALQNNGAGYGSNTGSALGFPQNMGW